MKQQDDLEKYQDIDATNNDIKPIISLLKKILKMVRTLRIITL